MKTILTIIVFFVLTANFVHSQEDSVKFSSNDFLKIFSASETNLVQISYNKKAIPYPLKKIIKNRYNGKVKITNPQCYGEHATIQLMFLLKNEPYYALIYNFYGRSLMTYFAFFKVSDKKVMYYKIYIISSKIKTVDDFLQEIEQNKYKIIE